MSIESAKISIVIPCYNEEKNVGPLADKLVEIMDETNYKYEIIFTDNCSTDGTRNHLRELAQNNKSIKVLMNSRNYGIDGRSGRNALRYVSGNAVILMACDFQDPPELIPEFLKWWEQGYKVVCGQKTSSKEGKIKYHLRDLFYRIINSLSETPQYSHISGITLMDREVLDEWLKTDHDYYLRFALADMGYQIKLIDYQQQKRRSGKSSYNIWRYLTFAIDSMVSTSRLPIRMITVIGGIMSILSFLIGLFYLSFKLRYWNLFTAGTAPILIGLFFFGSVQLFFLGIIGEYVGVILRKVTHRPDVILSEKINFEDEDSGGDINE